MVVLLIIDMQAGTFYSDVPPYDAGGVIFRINALAEAVRARGGAVVFIQHDGAKGNVFEPGTAGWQIIPELERLPGDDIVNKTACDAFYRTDLKNKLDKLGVTELLVTGSATDYCVDTTVRAAASLDYRVIVAGDAHTTSDREHLSAADVIQHHSRIWNDLTLPGGGINVVDTKSLLARLEDNDRDQKTGSGHE